MSAVDALVLRDTLLARAASLPGHLAYHDGAAGLSFAELAERAGSRARALQAAGVAERDRVAVVMSAGLAFTEVFWGLQLLGAVPSVFAPAPGVEARIAALDPRLVVTDELAATLHAPGDAVPAAAIGPDDLAFLQQTSGTSGTPRAAMIAHRSVLGYLRTCGDEGQVQPEDVLVAWVPPWHDLGLVHFVLGAVHHGTPCHLVEPAVRTLPAWLRRIAEVRGTVSGAPDFAYRLAMRMVPAGSVDLSSLRITTNGGEPVRASTIRAFSEHFGLAEGVVSPGYGMAEVALGISRYLGGAPPRVDARGNVASGQVMEHIDVRAGASAEVPEEILVRGDAVFDGYLGNEEDTAAALRDGWLHTGDSGYLDADGYLYVLGRRAGMIKRGGAAVAPRELEEAAQRVPGVSVAAATSVAGGVGGREDTIVVVVESDGSRDEAALPAAVSREIAAALGFAPGRVDVVPRRAIPRTVNGKIQHAALRDLLEAGPLAQRPAAPQPPTA